MTFWDRLNPVWIFFAFQIPFQGFVVPRISFNFLVHSRYVRGKTRAHIIPFSTICWIAKTPVCLCMVRSGTGRSASTWYKTLIQLSVANLWLSPLSLAIDRWSTWFSIIWLFSWFTKLWYLLRDKLLKRDTDEKPCWQSHGSFKKNCT